jgi:hypothetical protein
MRKNILLITALLALLCYLIQPFFTWFTADDFCFLPQVQAEGLFQNMWNHYMTWDGRGLSLTYIVARVGLWSGIYWLGPMLASVLFMLFGGLVLHFFLPQKQNRKEKIISLSVITGLLWLSAFHFSSQTLYWSTGAGYNLDIILILAGCVLFEKFRRNTPFILGSFPILFYVGTASPNAFAGLLFLITLNATLELKEQLGQWVKYFWLLLPMLAGFLMVILAPGNANRLVGMDSSNFTHIWTIYFNTGLILKNLIEYSTPVTWMLLLFGLIGGWHSVEAKRGFKEHLYAHRFLFAAIISAYFFMALPSVHAPRTNIHFSAFIMMYAVAGLGTIIKAMPDKVKEFKKPLQIITLLVFLIIGLSQAFDAYNTRKRIIQRDAKLKGLKGQVVVLGKEDNIKEPITRRFEDMGSNPNYWLNRCVADYYGLKSIVMIKDNK